MWRPLRPIPQSHHVAAGLRALGVDERGAGVGELTIVEILELALFHTEFDPMGRGLDDGPHGG
jgi:hypothetical protein